MERAQVIRTPEFSERWTLELLWALASYRISIRYKETLLGFGWIFLQPVGLTFIFNYIRRIANISSGEIPYPLFTAVGLVAWSLTALAVSGSIGSISGHAVLLKRVALPKMVLPLSVVVATIADLAAMTLLLGILFVYYGISISWTAAWIPLLLALHFAFLFGLSCLVALMNILFRDIGHAFPSLLQLWFFASPVFYPSSMVPEALRLFSQWNPMTGFIEGYRAVLLLGQQPSFDLLWPAIVVTLGMLAAGLICLQRFEGMVADLV